MKLSEQLLGALIMSFMFFIMAVVYGVRTNDVGLVFTSLKIIGCLLLVAAPVALATIATR